MKSQVQMKNSKRKRVKVRIILSAEKRQTQVWFEVIKDLN